MSIYIIGHKSPDLDSVAAAIAFANLKNKLENTNEYKPAITQEANQVTKYILEKFSISIPEILEDASEKKIILVDHNEASQTVNGFEKADIIEILDHHKLNFQNDKPITITVKPLGSSCSIIAQMYFENNIELDKNIAGLLLSAILDDTVITKSPTCTETDKALILKLSGLSAINDWQAHGLEMFKIKSSIKNFTEMQIIKNDFKDFAFKAGKFGIGQVEMVDLSEVDARTDAIFSEMKKLHSEENYHSLIIFFTDIINEGSRFLVVSNDTEKIEEALGQKLENNIAYIPGILSRKKQVVPMFSKIFD